jgi:hypothetical protein
MQSDETRESQSAWFFAFCDLRNLDPTAVDGALELHAELVGSREYDDRRYVDQYVADLLGEELDWAVKTEQIRFERIQEISPPLPKEEELPAEPWPTAPDPDNVNFYIMDPFSDPVSGFDWILTYPDGQTATGTLGKDGRVSRRSVPQGSYRLVLKLLSNARWGDSELEVDKPTTLIAHAGANEPGSSGTFEVFDGRGADRKPIATVKGKVNDANDLEATWTPTKAETASVTTGSLIFRAKLGVSTAVSRPATLSVRHTFELEDDEGPLADTPLIARFSDGHEVKEQVTGGKVAVLVPVGQRLLWVDLPEHPGAHLTIQEEGLDSRDYLLWESSDEHPIGHDSQP